MSLYIDEKYLTSIAHQLRNFKKKSDHVWNFSCPVCGDSKKKKLKARGYVFRNEDSLVFKCHNCGNVLGIGEFIRHIDPCIYKEYVYESFLEKKGSAYKEKEELDPVKDVSKPLFKKKSKPAPPALLASCSTIASLGPEHPARQYLESRLIPKKFLEELYWTDDFPEFVNNFNPDHGFKLVKEGRIIIPFLDRKNQLVTIQGRSLSATGLRYITIKAFEDASRIFGMHRLNIFGKRIYCFEGPIDSLFIPNSIGMAGSDIPQGLPVDNMVIVYDNEPRNKEICKKMEAAIEKGYRTCIWPNTIKQKDVNLMIMNGISASKVRGIIDNNSFVGLEAKFRFQQWRKD